MCRRIECGWLLVRQHSVARAGVGSSLRGSRRFWVTTTVQLCALAISGLVSIPLPSALAAELLVPGQYLSIQDATDAGVYGDVVVVSPGDYYEQIELRSGVSLRGEAAIDASVRLMGAGGAYIVHAASVTAMTFSGFELSGEALDGLEALMVLEESSPTIYQNNFTGSDATGLLAVEGSNATIEENTLSGNTIGLVLEGGSNASVRANLFYGNSTVAVDIGELCFPELTGNEFRENQRSIRCNIGAAPWITDNSMVGTLSDSVVLDGASPSIEGNLFDSISGIAIDIQNGSQPIVEANQFTMSTVGIRVDNGAPLILENWFTLNQDAAILLESRAYPTLLHNILQDNGYGIVMAGIEDGDASPHIFNNTIITSIGHGIHCRSYAFPVIDNNIVAFNQGNGIMCEAYHTIPTMAYNDVYGNSSGDYGGFCSAEVTDQSVNPMFTTFSDDGDPTNDDLHLLEGSAAVDAGNPQPEYNDNNGTRNDQGAYGGPDDPVFVDTDGDGFTEQDGDCNDIDPSVNPGADELYGDGVDNNCDGYVDMLPPEEPVTPATTPGDDGAGGDDGGGGSNDGGGGNDDDGGGDDDAENEGVSGDDDTNQDDEANLEPTPYPDALYVGEGCVCRVGRDVPLPPGRSSIHLGLFIVGIGWMIRKRARRWPYHDFVGK